MARLQARRDALRQTGPFYGTLKNSPASVRTADEGDGVRVRGEEWNDWMCGLGATPTGAFTLKVSRDRNRDESQSAVVTCAETTPQRKRQLFSVRVPLLGIGRAIYRT
ncbi:MAG: DUF2314 domain-containing protein [Planctomycetes bacterium]|nr:DUF2314 domain-containing protein [Planctomycetota bacterium]MBL7044341.1 DUF2314 domain-containing protein [Pirellulaceae bacterium]